MSNTHSLQVEKHLAVAHRALWLAASEAELMRDQGVADDLYQIAMEVGRLNLDLLLDRKPRPKLPARRT